MGLFDTNIWYTVYPSTNDSLALHGSNLTDGRAAAWCALKAAGTGKTKEFPNQQWQFYQNNDSYVLRNKGSGPNSYFVAGAPNGSIPMDIAGNTVPQMSDEATIDNSMFWNLTAWGDGSFYFSNEANGTDWHMQLRDNRLLAMSSDVKGNPLPSQKFMWKPGAKINNQAYSTIDTPTGIATTSVAGPTDTASPTSTALPTASTSSSSSSGLSTGAKAGVGAAGGGIALLILAILGFVSLRHRKKRPSEKASIPGPTKDSPDAEAAKTQDQFYYKAELPQQDYDAGVIKKHLATELPDSAADQRHSHVELQTEQRSKVEPVELHAYPRQT